jgi:16S rRNA (adenine1518-N6/adenine1519-N6)-dimethyltransferase
MVQKEVAQRIVASPGGKTYGALSVGVQAAARVEACFDVARAAFRPVPDVDSAVVRITPYPGGPGVEPDALRAVTRACFNRRRKQLQKILRTAPELDFAEAPEPLLERLGIDPAARPETLAPSTFIALAKALR